MCHDHFEHSPILDVMGFARASVQTVTTHTELPVTVQMHSHTFTKRKENKGDCY